MKKRTRDLFLLLATPAVMSFMAGCAGTGLGDGIGDIDIASYMEDSEMSKDYIVQKPAEPEESITKVISIQDRIGDNRKIVVSIGGWVNHTINIRADVIDTTYTLPPVSILNDRYVDIGDRTFSSCIVDSRIDNFSRNGHSYNGDILKLIGCESSGHATYYMKLGVGIIAKINDVDDEYTYLVHITV